MSLRNVPVATLRAELARREKGAAKLQKKHTMLSRVLATLEAELAGLGVPGGKRRGRPPGSKNKKRRGRPPGSKNRNRGRKPGRRGRAKNALSLSEALAKAVRVGTTVSPAEAMAAVKRIYKTASKSFNVQVTIGLAKSPAFKKTGRGQYLRKGSGSTPPAMRGPRPKMGRRARKRGGRHRKPGRPKGNKTSSAAPAGAQIGAS